jgi:anti-sigma-K factor RskA
MRRVWATVVSVWAVVAIVAVLAWTRAQAPAPVTGATPTVMLVKGKNGKQQLVVVQSSAAAHATTQTSPAPPV